MHINSLWINTTISRVVWLFFLLLFVFSLFILHPLQIFLYELCAQMIRGDVEWADRRNSTGLRFIRQQIRRLYQILIIVNIKNLHIIIALSIINTQKSLAFHVLVLWLLDLLVKLSLTTLPCSACHTGHLNCKLSI